jgi:ribosome-associated heat shock protein Hsp15
MQSLRIDKWLWAARFYKTRSLASEEVSKNRVQINGQDAKPSREVKVGVTLSIRQGTLEKTVIVKGISAMRGSAPEAQMLYEETAESLAKRTREAELNRLAREPAHSIEHGRPTKRDRRQIEHAWNDRWSASAD